MLPDRQHGSVWRRVLQRHVQLRLQDRQIVLLSLR